MRDFIKKTLINFCASVATLALLFFLGIFLFNTVISSLSFKPMQANVPGEGALVLDLSMSVTDAPSETTFGDVVEQALSEDRWRAHMHLRAILDAIREARTDERIKALVIHGSTAWSTSAPGFASTMEIRKALEEFRQSGKRLVAYSEYANIRDFLLLSVADELYVNPAGTYELKGLAAEAMFLKGAFDKYGFEMQTSVEGQYKSAPEMFTRQNMSEPAREQVEDLLGEIWEGNASTLANSRGLPASEIHRIAAEEPVFGGRRAVELGLADRAVHLDEVVAEMGDSVGWMDDKESFAQINLPHYGSSMAPKQGGLGVPELAVVYVEGPIVGGEGTPTQAGADRIARELRHIRRAGNARALVVRVNSPGGSSAAAEKIRREISLLAEEIPVVVSMGDVAASGGYWISATADTIFAEPSTITGSIGVFWVIPNVQGFANDHGVTFDRVKTSEHADIFSLTRSRSPKEMQILDGLTSEVYRDFKELVAEGREMTLDEVEAVAQGHVYTGAAARQNNLVDEAGGLHAAIVSAAVAANLGKGNYHVVEYPRKRGLNEMFVRFIGETRSGAFWDALGLGDSLAEPAAKLLEQYDDPRAVYARLPYLITVE